MKTVTAKRRDIAAPAGKPLGLVLQRYFCHYLIDQRQLSPRTIAAYRDTVQVAAGIHGTAPWTSTG